MNALDLEGKLRREETEAAIEVITQWAVRDAQNASAFAFRAMLYAQLGMFKEAVEDYNRVAALDWGRGVTAHVTRGFILCEQGKYKEAVADFNIAAKSSPRDATIYRLRGVARLNAGDYEKAKSDFERAVQFEPQSPWSHLYLAQYYAACPSSTRRNGSRAIEHAKKALELTGGNQWSCLDTLAMAYAESGMFDQAIAAQRQALAAAPGTRKKVCQDRLSLYEASRPFRFGR